MSIGSRDRIIISRQHLREGVSENERERETERERKSEREKDDTDDMDEKDDQDDNQRVIECE